MRPHNQGISLVEALIASAIIVVVIASVSATYSLYISQQRVSTDRVRTTLLLEEGLEAVRSIRDRSWSASLGSWSPGTTYHIAFNNAENQWEATTTPQLIDGKFARYFTVHEVRRDSNDDIASSGMIDPNTKRVKMVVDQHKTPTTGIAFTGGTTDDDLAGFPSDDTGDGNPAQSITTGSNEVKVAMVDLFLKRTENTDPSDVYLEIRETSPVGSVLATSDMLRSDNELPEESLAWSSFTFPTPPTLTANTTYYLRLRSTPPSTEASSGSSGTIHWGYEETAGGAYDGGSAYRYVGSNSESDTGEELADHDFSFRVRSVGTTTSSSTTEMYLTDLFKN